ASKANQVVFDQSWTYLTGASNAPVVTEPFEIGGTHPQGVRAELFAGVENGWLGVDLDLVRVDTQATETASLEVGFYTGYDDGPWQEGRRDADLVVPSVAPGRYRLVVEPEGQPGVSEVTYRVRLVRDVMVWSNVWLGLLLLLAYPAYRWLREHAFERGRWSASDFSPFTPVSEWVESDDD
ncbi:MAG: hypothetical protein J0L84_10930, partial [Verrucomicrobia bacterium]|nr:hypothetical protein [Verrucomicrobiota bacterium]